MKSAAAIVATAAAAAAAAAASTGASLPLLDKISCLGSKDLSRFSL